MRCAIRAATGSWEDRGAEIAVQECPEPGPEWTRNGRSRRGPGEYVQRLGVAWSPAIITAGSPRRDVQQAEDERATIPIHRQRFARIAGIYYESMSIHRAVMRSSTRPRRRAAPLHHTRDVLAPRRITQEKAGGA